MNAVRGSAFKGPNNLVIQAHQSEITIMSLSSDGTRLATSSEKGTIIPVFETATRGQLQELRRGTERATLCSLAFNYQRQGEAFRRGRKRSCSHSDRSLCAFFLPRQSTMHVFTIEADTKRDRTLNDTFGLRPVSSNPVEPPADFSPISNLHSNSISEDSTHITPRASSRIGSQSSGRTLASYVLFV